jgi:hypothetical protein
VSAAAPLAHSHVCPHACHTRVYTRDRLSGHADARADTISICDGLIAVIAKQGRLIFCCCITEDGNELIAYALLGLHSITALRCATHDYTLNFSNSLTLRPLHALSDAGTVQMALLLLLAPENDALTPSLLSSNIAAVNITLDEIVADGYSHVSHHARAHTLRVLARCALAVYAC